LVKLIREEHGDYFGIAVAGFPEGHPLSKIDLEAELIFLKEKVDAGADFILTQFFYEPELFLSFRRAAMARGITCPIIPGMMPIQSYSSFQKMTSFCRTKVPDRVWEALLPIKDDDEQVKMYGVHLCVDMCKRLSAEGVKGFHFYTLNLEKSVTMVLEHLGVQDSLAIRR
jgi:methylenetetrahydrofolate reductase (NADPH)